MNRKGISLIVSDWGKGDLCVTDYGLVEVSPEIRFAAWQQGVRVSDVCTQMALAHSRQNKGLGTN